VFYAQELLMKLNFSPDLFVQEFAPRIGQEVLVIGNKSDALDCARACRRLGRSVSIILSETEGEIDAHRHEVAYSREEGVDFQTLLRPEAIKVDGAGRVVGLTCRRMDFAEKNGRWVLTPVPGTEEALPADTVILAQGQEVNPQVKKMLPGLKFNTDGTVWLNEETGQTSVPKVFAAGDMVDGREHILDAMISGKWAAEQVIRFLKK